jgi:choline-glycine betaine transporter
MIEPLPVLLLLWATFCVVLLIYAVYRFRTDKSDGSVHHWLYPFLSKRTDGTFPRSGSWIDWLAYVCLLLGFSSFIVAVAEPPWYQQFVTNIAGPSLLLGCVLLVVSRLSRRK